MIGRSSILWLSLIAAATGVLFQTSYRVQELETTLTRLNHEIVAEQEAMHVLQAEWSYLNEPARIEKLAAAHLPLKATVPGQLVAIADVPEKPAAAETLVSATPLPGRKPVPVAAGLTVADLGPIGSLIALHGTTR